MTQRYVNVFSAATFVLAVAALWFGSVQPGQAEQASAQVAQADGNVSKANRFNRLFKGAGQYNLPPAEDGIHDDENPGTHTLQPPKEAFGALPNSKAGNRVDWVQALQKGHIDPRADRLNPDKKMTVLDLNIVRQVKGTMPDVVYPHKPHTEWLDCRNCHPKIFIPKKGGNPISMAAILSGQYCGVCHGKVAFPVSECRQCHSKDKSKEQVAEREAKRKSEVKAPNNKQGQTVQIAAAKPVPAAGPDRSKADLMKIGAKIYGENCSGCHGEKGEGVPGTFPALKGSKVASGPAATHIDIVVNGKPDTAMQAWKDSLSPDDMAAVITFERASWGNKGDVVQSKQVAAVMNGGAAPAKKAAPAKDMSKKDLMANGKAVYENNCSGCHGADGEGVPGVFPALKGSKLATGAAKNHIDIVMNGKAGTAMQSWRSELSDADLAAVITYERNALGNSVGDVVQPGDIAAAR